MTNKMPCIPSRNIQANAQRKKKCSRPATMPHTIGLSVWLMPARNNTSATSRHTQRFLWIVVRSDCKKKKSQVNYIQFEVIHNKFLLPTLNALSDCEINILCCSYVPDAIVSCDTSGSHNGKHGDDISGKWCSAVSLK